MISGATQKNHYQVLGLSNNATHDEIRIAYRKLSLEYHPDKISKTKITLEQANLSMKELNEAYSVLSSPDSRKVYDKEIADSNSPSNNTNRNYHPQPSDFDFCWDYLFNLYKESSSRNDNRSSRTSNFGEQPKKPSASPSADNRKIINDFIKNDEHLSLHEYLTKNDFNTQSFLEELTTVAAKVGALNVVKYFVEERAVNPNLFVWESFFSGSLFKCAAGSGNLALVKYLLEVHHADIESQGKERGTKATALSQAVLKGHLPIVEYLISKGANVNPEVANSNILNGATYPGKLAIFKLLVESGAKLDDTHLKYALQRGNLETVQYILQIKPGIDNYHFLEPIGCLAVYSGNLNMLKYLEQHKSLDIFKPSFFEQDDDQVKIKLLASAARSGNIEMMQYLLDEKGLALECRGVDFTRNVECVLAGAIPESSFDSKELPVQERLKFVRYLIEERNFTLPFEALKSITLNFAKTIEMNAYLQSYDPHLEKHKLWLRDIALGGLEKLSIPELFRLYNLNIIKRGNYNDFEHEIREHIQSKKLSNEQLQSLSNENSLFLKDALFYHLHYSHAKDLSKLQFIIDLGIDINSENDYGFTPLQFAYKSGRYNDIVKLLIDNGADVYKKNANDKSIYDFMKDNTEFNGQLERLSKQNSVKRQRL